MPINYQNDKKIKWHICRPNAPVDIEFDGKWSKSSTCQVITKESRVHLWSNKLHL